MPQVELMDVSKLREVVALVVREAPVPHSVVQAAHETVRDMRQQGAQYGLSDRDVVAAVLKSVFTKRRGCNCWACKSRREADLGLEEAGSVRTA